MEECSCKATVFAQRELTEVRVIGITSINSMVYSFIALPQSETILNLKSVNIDMGYNNFCSSNVQVIIFAGLDSWSFLYLSSLLEVCWNTNRQQAEKPVEFLRPTNSEGVFPFPYVKSYLPCFSLEWKF